MTEGDMSLTPQSSIQDGEQADEVPEVYESEQVPSSKTAHTSGETAQAGQDAEAEAGGKSHAVNTANEGGRLSESDTKIRTDEIVEADGKSHQGEEAPKSKDFHKSGSETQAGGAASADETSHEVEIANEGEDQHEDDMNTQSDEDKHAGETPQEDETAHKITTETHSGR